MCNHAQSLTTSLGYHVDLVGYYDTHPHDALINNPNISFIPLKPPPDALGKLPEALQLVLKLFWTYSVLLMTLLFQTRSSLDVILAQCPPALPTHFVCYFVSRVKRAKFAIDWHNYMYSILLNKYRMSEDDVFGTENSRRDEGRKASEVKKWIVWLVAMFEGWGGKLADANLCVSRAMKEDLRRRWCIKADVFYDRPPSWKFKQEKTSLASIHELYGRLSKLDGCQALGSPELQATAITNVDEAGKIALDERRPFVVFSATSWTPDENFEHLLDAIKNYDRTCATSHGKLPRLLVIVTGRGQLKQVFMDQIAKEDMANVDVVTPWLEAADYPVMVASADVGVSLHESTSGLDLPMKVVDMFGARIPVLAKRFHCIGELVEDGRNGYLFDTANELGDQIVQLANGFPSAAKKLDALKGGVLKKEFETWEDMWMASAAPHFSSPTDDNSD